MLRSRRFGIDNVIENVRYRDKHILAYTEHGSRTEMTGSQSLVAMFLINMLPFQKKIIPVP